MTPFVAPARSRYALWTGSHPRRYQRTAQRISSGSVCRHLKIAGRIAFFTICSGYQPPLAEVATQPCGFIPRSLIIWDKGHIVIGRGHYHWRHETCWYAVKKGAQVHDRPHGSVSPLCGRCPGGRPKGELERLAVRRLAALRYRLAGATYSVIAETMKQLPHVSETHGLGRRDSGVGGTLARDGDAARGPDGARERPVGSGVLEGAVAVREWHRAGWPTGYRDDGTAVPTASCRHRSPVIAWFAAATDGVAGT